MTISLIVARSRNNVIGYKNKIPWSVPTDLAYFKKKTLNHYVIMGRKTYESINYPLPLRKTIVISRNSTYEVPSGVILKDSLQKAISFIKKDSDPNLNYEEIFIAGGRQIYELALPIAKYIYVTEIDCSVNGDTFFPSFEGKNWKKIKSEYHQADTKNEYNFTFNIYEKH